jgi:hypothetical protein
MSAGELQNLEDNIQHRMLPKDSRIKILFTTRERCLSTEFESIALDVLPLDKCVELLIKIVGTAKVEKKSFSRTEKNF